MKQSKLHVPPTFAQTNQSRSILIFITNFFNHLLSVLHFCLVFSMATAVLKKTSNLLNTRGLFSVCHSYYYYLFQTLI